MTTSPNSSSSSGPEGEHPVGGLDAAFLALETPTTPLHVIAVAVLDTGGLDPEAFATRFRERVRARLGELPELQRQLAAGSTLSEGPIWVDVAEDELDLETHIRRDALPSPGGESELADLVGRTASRPLDRARPLWEMILVEGLCGERTALVAKVHHALVDGVGGAAMLARLCDRPDAHGVERPAPSRPTGEARERPGRETGNRSRGRLMEAALGAVAAGVTLPLRITKQLLRTTRTVARVGLHQLGLPPSARTTLPFSGSETRLSGAVTHERSVAFADVSMDDLRVIGRHFDAKLNDVVLASCTSALRAYLERIDGDAPTGPMVAAVPVALPSDDRAEAANSVSGMLVSLPVDESDPVLQLRRVQAASRAAKDVHGHVDSGLVHDWADAAPTFVLDSLSSAYARLDLADHHAAPFDVIVSNVPGPPEPLDCLGARVEACHPFGPIYENAALNITVLSYAGRLCVGAIGCPRNAPDLHHLTDAFASALTALVDRASERAGANASPRREPEPERLESAAARSGAEVEAEVVVR